MSGIVVPVLRYRELNYSFVASGSEETIVRDKIPVSPYTVIGLSVRVHALNLGSNASFQLVVRGVNPSEHDSQDFVLPTDLGSTSTITSSTSPPALVALSSVITDPQTPYVRVVLKATQSGASANLWGILSADLVLKTG